MKNCPFEKEKNVKKRYTKLLFGPEIAFQSKNLCRWKSVVFL